MKNVTTVLGNLGQWTACFVITVGIIVEIRYGADIGYISITTGSLLFAIFTKIKYYKSKAEK